MNRRVIAWAAGWALVLSLAACGNPSQLAPIATSTAAPLVTATATTTRPPTATLPPTLTPTRTPAPTNTPRPSRTPTAQPTLGFGPEQLIEAGGFSFRPPLGYNIDIQGNTVGVLDPAGRVIISFVGTANDNNLGLEASLDDYLDSVAKRGNGAFTKVLSRTVTIDGVEALAYTLTGTFSGAPIEGEAVIVFPRPRQLLFGLGIANLSKDPQGWDNRGAPVFAGLVESIRFAAPPSAAGTAETIPQGPCSVSSDPTYGYTEANAIRVGGDFFEGPARERVYLDNLRGPNGEALTYVRVGSVPFGDVILDRYELQGLNQSVTLYLDIYGYAPPLAPQGLSCAAAFSLNPP